MKKKMFTLAAVTVFAFALAACATPQTGSDSTPTAEPTVEVEATTAPTVEPEATSTPVPTSTPEPTATSTPEPTATSTPVPTATPEPTPEPVEAPTLIPALKAVNTTAKIASVEIGTDDYGGQLVEITYEDGTRESHNIFTNEGNTTTVAWAVYYEEDMDAGYYDVSEMPDAMPEVGTAPFAKDTVDDGNNVSVPDYIAELLALETGDERSEYYWEYISDLDDCELIVTDSWNEKATQGEASVTYIPLYNEFGFAYFGVYALQSTTGEYPTVVFMVELCTDDREPEYWFLTYEEFVDQYGTPDEILARVDEFIASLDN